MNINHYDTGEPPLREELIEFLSKAQYGAPEVVAWRDEDDRWIRWTATIVDDDESGFEHINGCDTYGKVAWVTPRRDAYAGCFSGSADDAPRPAGFTGAARKLRTIHGDRYWWEPYRDSGGVYDGPVDRQAVIDLIEYGLMGITVSRGNECPCCGEITGERPAQLFGIEALATDKYKASIIAELIDEITGGHSL